FRAAQDSVAMEMYYVPALRFAAAMGVGSALGRAALLDAIVQHGGGDDPDGLPAMLAATRADLGTPTTAQEERAWLARFLTLRQAVLECPHAEATRDVWRASTSRVDVFRQLLDGGNLSLESPLVFELDDRTWTLEPR